MRILPQITLPVRVALLVGLYHAVKSPELLEIGEAGDWRVESREEVDYTSGTLEKNLTPVLVFC